MNSTISLSVPLFDDENFLNPSFIKSKRWIITNYQKNILQSINKHLCIEELYKEKFKAKLSPSYPESWKQLEFKNQKDRAIFLLTWS